MPKRIGYVKPEGKPHHLHLYLSTELEALFDAYHHEHRHRSRNDTGIALLRKALGDEVEPDTLETRIEKAYVPSEIDPLDYQTPELFEAAKKRWPGVPITGEAPSIKVHKKEEEA